MSSTSRRFNRTLFTAPAPPKEQRDLVVQLEGEDVELVLDTCSLERPDLARACADAEMYYVRQPDLPSVLKARDPSGERLAAEAAHLALRHRTCLLADEEVRTELAEAVAGVVGMRVLDVAVSPAFLSVPGAPKLR
jgi:hypothetical protein